MILIDTSVWIVHFRSSDPELLQVLTSREALTHPLVIGELAMGNLSNRYKTLQVLQELPAVSRATDAEVLDLVETRRLYGTGIGFPDAHLIASCLLDGATLWTRDRKMRAGASKVEGLRLRQDQ